MCYEIIMLYSLRQVCRFSCEFTGLNVFAYFATRLFELLFIAIFGNRGLHHGVDLNEFAVFSPTSLIIGLILSLIVLKWEYGVRETIRVQNYNQMLWDLEKMENDVFSPRSSPIMEGDNYNNWEERV